MQGEIVKEIGGYIELDSCTYGEYHNGLIPLNLGRNCLRYLIRAAKISRIYMPYYICDTVTAAARQEKCEIQYYHITKDLRPMLEEVPSDAWIYIINYFGQITEEEILFYKKKYRNIILDNAQDFFCSPLEGVHTIYTCRKFFGVPDGAYLYTDLKLDEELVTEKSSAYMSHILGRKESSASDYYASFQQTEELFCHLPIRFMSNIAKALLGRIDYIEVQKKRHSNFQYLHQQLKNRNELKLSVPEGPFMYPLLIPGGKTLKNKLIKKHIYVPTLWPNISNDCEKNSFEYYIGENMVCIPCDHRYNETDMEYIVACINNQEE